jgi:N-acetylneuraminic acid mutarotase
VDQDNSLPETDSEEALRNEATAWNWMPLARLEVARELPRLRRLPESDQVIIVGGGSELGSSADNTTEVYGQRAREWRPGPKLHYPHRDAEVMALGDGSLLAIGGSDGPTKTGSRNVEILPARNGAWHVVAPLRTPRISHAACVLQDGRVLVTGGQQDPDTFLDSCEIYDPKTERWETTRPMSEVRATHHLRVLADGRVIAIGGGTDITATRSAEIFDPRSEAWVPTDAMRDARWGFASAILEEDNSIIVAGGRVPAQKGASIALDQMVILNGVERYDIEKEQWSTLTPMHTPRTMGIPNVELARLPDGGLLFPGGRTYPAPYHGTTSAEAFQPQTNSWRMLASMRVGASYHAFVTLDDGHILTAGGRGARFMPLRRSELFGRP